MVLQAEIDVVGSESCGEGICRVHALGGLYSL